MKKRTIKLTEAQVKQILSEDYPFSYFGMESTPKNHNSEVTANVPFDTPDFNPENTTSGEVAGSLSYNSWWNKGFGMSGYGR